jgi:dihydroneopterin aldolase/2-amino-4-hydroxy-6-hydroxymethyldihydropteridine diphosphokinase/dihydropteroate synthase/2-amino-4-hydroxy-6-hydroxymethyldihydropteridine diphosphokinase/dihydropteroate synthase
MLRALKDVERALGREPSPQRNLPRPIDLDILHVEGVGELRTPELELPHPRIAEREFVLRPLCDIAPDLRVPGLAGTARELLAALPRVDSEGAAQRVFPLRGDLMLPLGSRTLVMAVLNATPDSFSDGDAHESVEQRVERVARLVAAGADLVDVGGQSTRPGAQLVSVEEEMERTLPIICGVRRAADAAVARVPLSIDTFRAQVAHAALAEGADLVNDVSGGTRDANMLRVVAEARAPIVLMHMRGDAQTMQSATNTAYADLLR